MAEVWFTADTHFGHRMLVEKGYRPYSTVPEMDADLIDRWNSAVRPDDTVWHLGDFGMGGPRNFLPVLGQLHGTVHLVTGNHDHPWPGHRDSYKHQAAWMAAGFASIQAFARRRINGRTVVMSHFPYEGDHVDDDRAVAYRLRDMGEWLLHGHVHTEWAVRGRQVNVGVDVREFTPVPLAAVAEMVDPPSR